MLLPSQWGGFTNKNHRKPTSEDLTQRYMPKVGKNPNTFQLNELFFIIGKTLCGYQRVNYFDQEKFSFSAEIYSHKKNFFV